MIASPTSTGTGSDGARPAGAANYRGLFENARKGIIQTTPDGRILAANPAAAQIFGYGSSEEFLQGVTDIRNLYVHAAKRADLAGLLVAKGAVTDFEHEMRHKDGHLIWISSDIHLAHDEYHPTIFEGTVEDVTERKRAEAVVKESVQRDRRRRHNTISLEVALLFGLTGLIYALAAHFNWFESITWTLANRGPAQMDEVVVSVVFFIAGLSIFACRRWYESEIKATSQRQVEKALHQLRNELDLRVRQRTAELHQANQALQADANSRNRAGEALRLQGAALAAAANAIVITNRAGAVVWANTAFTGLTGYTLSEAFGKNPRDLVKSGQQDPAVYKDMWETIMSGRTWHGQMVNRRKDYTFYHEEQTITPVRDTQGEITHFIAIKQDLTERKRAESDVRDAESRYRLLFEKSPDGILILDPVSAQVLVFNESAHRMLDYPREEFARLGIPDFEAAESPEQIKARLAVVVANGRSDFETRLRTRLGAIKEVYVTVQVTEMDGRPVFHCVWRDITDRKANERRISEQNEILSNSREGVMIVDLNDRISFWNDGAAKLFGVTAAEALGRPPEKVICVEDLNVVAKLRAAVERDGFWNGELRSQARDGRKLIVENRVTLVRDEAGQPRARLNFFADITEKKMLEDQFLHAQRLESIGMLAAGIAHDLNNVLAPIMFAAPLLRESLSAPRDLKILETVEKSAGRGAGLVKQILGFAHATTGEFQTTQVKHLVRDIVGVIEETFPKSIQLEYDVPVDLWPVQGNATQIHQMLLNLCVNARDAMPTGGTLRIVVANRQLDARAVSAIPGGRPGTWLVLEVTDTGSGMSPELVERIWQPFFTTKGAGKGTGLGLSTVRGLVASHHGFIEVDTMVGRGTTFRVFLPAAEGEVSRSTSTSPFGVPEGNGELVMVVDDDAPIRDIVSSILTHHGYRVVTCSDGLEALNLFETRAGEFSVVVTDVDMPHLSGVALTRALLQLRPDLRLLAMSGLSRSEPDGTDLAAVQKLAHAFLLKPFKSEDLLRTLHRLLREPAAAAGSRQQNI